MPVKNLCLVRLRKYVTKNLIKHSEILCVRLHDPFFSSDYIQTCTILLKPVGHTDTDWVYISEIMGMSAYDIGFQLQ